MIAYIPSISVWLLDCSLLVRAYMDGSLRIISQPWGFLISCITVLESQNGAQNNSVLNKARLTISLPTKEPTLCASVMSL